MTKKPSANGVPASRRASDNLRDATRGVRLQKALASAGIDSRRRCEELVAEGAVTVNGQIVTSLPAWVDPEEDDIEVEGRRLPKTERKVCVMLNKPRRSVTTSDDPGGRRTVVDMVDHPLVNRLFPIGRLDFDTCGLILLTNDGELANRLAHPRYGVEKTYRVKVKGSVEHSTVDAMSKGLYLSDRRDGRTIGGRRTLPVDVQLITRDREKTTLDITLKEGRNREVRRIFAQLGHPVIRLERIRLGPVRLKGLRRGDWRELTRDELAALRKAVARTTPQGATSNAKHKAEYSPPGPTLSVAKRPAVGRASVGRASRPSSAAPGKSSRPSKKGRPLRPTPKSSTSGAPGATTASKRLKTASTSQSHQSRTIRKRKNSSA